MLATRPEVLAPTQVHSGISYKATEASIRGEFDKDGWVLRGGVEPLSWWFSAVAVSLLVSFVGSTLPGWTNISVA